jgi:chitosanase
VTYGRSQTTEYGNLDQLIESYVQSNSIYSAQLKPYIALCGVKPLVEDETFKQLLRDAGKNDPVMRKVQDDFFDEHYFKRAVQWADDNGFLLPLSALVIYDSYIHSGSIPDFLRKRFSEPLPAKNGDEKTWIKQYVDARQDWLGTASNPVLHATIYRTQCFKDEIAKNNWDLSQLPIDAHGVSVSG